MAQPYQEHYTIEDYRQWQGDWELIHGMPYAMTPSPGATHQRCVTLLARELLDGLEKSQECAEQCTALVEMDWEIGSDTVVRPDLLVTCQPHDERITRTPELVIEVVSASSGKRDEHIKFELYAQQGVSWYLLVYPDQQLTRVFHNESGRFVKHADVGKEEIDIPLHSCSLPLNFKRIWRD